MSPRGRPLLEAEPDMIRKLGLTRFIMNFVMSLPPGFWKMNVSVSPDSDQHIKNLPRIWGHYGQVVHQGQQVHRKRVDHRHEKPREASHGQPSLLEGCRGASSRDRWQ